MKIISTSVEKSASDLYMGTEHKKAVDLLKMNKSTALILLRSPNKQIND